MLQKYLKIVDGLLNKIPPAVQDLIFKSTVGLGVGLGLFAVYLGIHGGQKAASQKGLQMADSTKNLFSDETSRLRQKEFNREKAAEFNRENRVDDDAFTPNFRMGQAGPVKPIQPEGIPLLPEDKVSDFDQVYPATNDNPYVLPERPDEGRMLNREYSNRLLARERQTPESLEGESSLVPYQQPDYPQPSYQGQPTYQQPQPTAPYQQQPAYQQQPTYQHPMQPAPNQLQPTQPSAGQGAFQKMPSASGGGQKGKFIYKQTQPGSPKQ